MKWIDYREALGIGFCDKKKKDMFSNRIGILFDALDKGGSGREDIICRRYFFTVCERPDYYTWSRVAQSIEDEKQLSKMISKAVVFLQACKEFPECGLSGLVEEFLLTTLDDLKIPYELREDKDGKYIFPKGAKELDNGNVNAPYEWLKAYPLTRKAMSLALRAYSEQEDCSNTADLFRKALETFGQEFFHCEKTLENMKSVFGRYLKEKGVPAELAGNFETTLQMYSSYMNNYAKHHDKTSEKYLEFILYQTGNIIRFLISLSQ